MTCPVNSLTFMRTLTLVLRHWPESSKGRRKGQKIKPAGRPSPNSLAREPRKTFVAKKQIVTFPFLFAGNCDMEQQEEHCGGSDTCGGDEITLCFAVQANLQLYEDLGYFIHLGNFQPCFI